MAKRNKKHEKRVKKLIVICMLSAIILTVSTYAWFIGMQTVSVNAFEVNVAAADGLALSIDGVDFSDNVTINATTDLTDSYSSNTNKWTDLEPISTIGAMDSTKSRMVIYEKSSLTSSPGGYRLLSEKLDNTTGAEANGYVVFDLFVKNLSGAAYYEDDNKDNEEGIYMTLDSKVVVGNSGVEDTGIENSVRVAFAQIGRVKSDAAAAKVQGITCTDSSENGVTGICRDAAIWEPNNTAHVANAISWYSKSCQKRSAATTFSGTCNTIADGEFYETYSVAKTITENAKDDFRDYEVDVYDGAKYNGYTQSVTDGYLKAVDTFTDSEKILSGSSRPEFMTLAPNSITKVRVYVYIEGQDIDNYDFASLGKQISVNFGFTKERFAAEDFGYIENENVDLDDDLYRNFRVAYTAEGEVSGLPANVSYDASTKTLTILKSINKSFTFKDGEKDVKATRTETEEGAIDWTVALVEQE